jgi:hypothetical protein
MRCALVLLVCGLGVAGCALEKVELAAPEDVIVAEVILRAGDTTQLAWLHRTRGVNGDPTVPNAIVEVRGPAGVARFGPADDTICVTRRSDTPGSCYATAANALVVTPGQTYQLTIRVGGDVLTGTTTVPQDFTVQRPSVATCLLPPFTNLELVWRASPNAWVYASEANLRGIQDALRTHGVTVDRDPLRLFGLSISSADTTLAFPKEFGLFDRFDEDLTEALAFMQRGLPPGVVTDVIIAAADRNYVNWERGGNFNPSGQVRVPSIRGAGSGVFGSLVPRSFRIRTDMMNFPPC